MPAEVREEAIESIALGKAQKKCLLRVQQRTSWSKIAMSALRHLAEIHRSLVTPDLKATTEVGFFF
jgi:hypothetical protein